MILELELNSGNSFGRVNGVPLGTDTYTDVTTLDPDKISLGARFQPTEALWGQNDYAEIVFLTAPTAAQVAGVRQYLARKYAIGIASGDLAITGNLLLRGDQSVMTLWPTSNTPPTPGTSFATRIYVKGNKLIVQFNDAGTVKYRYMDLTGAAATWTYTTIAP
jgi:hypothetical protein